MINIYASSLPLGERLFNDFILKDRYMYLVQGLGNTLLITTGALIIGCFIGVILALIRVTYQKGNRNFVMKILNLFAGLYLTVIRGTPIIVQLMIMYFVILVSGAPLVVAILSFGINSGAYIAEIIRGGIQSINPGQEEAGRSLGLTGSQTMIYIILPQAFKNAAPAIFNEFIALLKETSVAGYVGIPDLTKGGDIIRSITYDAFPPLIAVAGIYLVIVIFLTYILRIIERRLAKSDRH